MAMRMRMESAPKAQGSSQGYQGAISEKSEVRFGPLGTRVCSLLGELSRAGFTRGHGDSGGDIVVRVQGRIWGPSCCREAGSTVSGLGKSQGLFLSNMAALCFRLVRGAGCPVPGVYILDIPLASYL